MVGYVVEATFGHCSVTCSWLRAPREEGGIGACAGRAVFSNRDGGSLEVNPALALPVLGPFDTEFRSFTLFTRIPSAFAPLGNKPQVSWRGQLSLPPAPP